MKKIIDSMAWPSVLILHGLGFLLLVASAFGFDRRKEYLISVVLAVSVGLLAYIVHSLRAGVRPISLVAMDWIFLSFIGLVLGSMGLQGLSAPGVRANVPYVLFLMIVPYLCGRLMLRRDLRLFSKTLVFVFCFSLVVALFIFLFIEDGRFHCRPLMHGRDEIAARMAQLTTYVCLIAVYFHVTRIPADDRRWQSSVVPYLVLAALIFLLSFLGFRGIVLASAIAVAAGSLKARWMSNSRRIFVTAFYIAVIACSALLLQGVSEKCAKSLHEVYGVVDAGMPSGCGASEKADNSISIRLELFRDAWKQFLSNPTLGVGAGAYGQTSCWKSPVAHPHNVILQALAELGLLGAGVLSAMLAWGVIHPLGLRWQRGDYMNLAYMLFVFASVNSLINGNYFTSVELWWTLGVMAAWSSTGSEPQLTTGA